MINKVKNIIKNLENKTLLIMKNGFKFCFLLCIISVFSLLIYIFLYSNPYLFVAGVGLFKMSLIFSIEFLICGIVVDSIKKKLI